jgi:hypothetical protein
MVDAEKRLLAHALQDPENQHFVLLSERLIIFHLFCSHLNLSDRPRILTLYSNCSCVPLHNFDYIYSYLMETNVSFVDW